MRFCWHFKGIFIFSLFSFLLLFTHDSGIFSSTMSTSLTNNLFQKQSPRSLGTFRRTARRRSLRARMAQTATGQRPTRPVTWSRCPRAASSPKRTLTSCWPSSARTTSTYGESSKIASRVSVKHSALVSQSRKKRFLSAAICSREKFAYYVMLPVREWLSS